MASMLYLLQTTTTTRPDRTTRKGVTTTHRQRLTSWSMHAPSAVQGQGLAGRENISRKR